MTGFVLSYLVNALWQVPLVVAAAWLAARLLRAAGPLAEHRVWATAAVLQTLLPACSGSARAWLGALHLQAGHHADGSSITVELGPASASAGLHLSPLLAGCLLAAYALGLAYGTARLLHAFALTRRMRRHAQPLTLPCELEPVWSACRQHFGLHETQLAESESLRSPITLGHPGPVIVLPAGLLSALDPDDLATVLLHESAHIARHDYGWNLLFQVLALPLAFHPIHAIALARLTETREIVCDALAAEAASTPTLDGRAQYARSLLRLASTLVQGASAAAPHAIGIFDAHVLERRIMNLTRNTPRPSLARRAALASCALILCATACTGALALRTTVVPHAAAPLADPVRVQGGVMAGALLSHVNPVYPQAARDAHIQGSVVLHAIIARDGVIDKLTVVSGPPELTGSALDAVRQWVYRPYLLNGEPTEVDTTITVNYMLGR